jgi:2-phospho-L-lactate guanylyltransferase
MRTVAILPVKGFAQAKQRLRGELPAGVREALVEAMLEDMLDALSRASSIAELVLVTVGGPTGSAARALGARFGVRTVVDRGEGHNPAAARGIAAALRRGAERALVLPGDCPAVDPAEIDSLLHAADPPPSVVVVPDRHGSGTNALVLTPPDVLAPSFGPGSRARHQRLALAAGIRVRVAHVPSLALDIDTAEDLHALADAGRAAARTLALLVRC